MSIAEYSSRASDLAHQNELQALWWTHKFGWLTAADLACATRMHIDVARRVFARLETREYVLREHVPGTKTRAYRLSLRGADLLNHALESNQFRSGEDVAIGSYFIHRHLANRYVIAAVRLNRDNDYEPSFFSEHDIVARRAPLHICANKMADGLLLHPQENGEVMVEWIEAEHAYKSRPDYKRLLRFALKLSEPDSRRVLVPRETLADDTHYVLQSMIIVCGKDSPHFRRLLRAVQAIIPFLTREAAQRLLSDLAIAVEDAPYHFDVRPVIAHLPENIMHQCKSDDAPHDSMMIEKAITAATKAPTPKNWIDSALRSLGFTVKK